MVGMFAYRVASGHWRVQTGITGIGEEGPVTAATVIPLAAVVGWEQQRAEWVDVGWLAMRVHVEKMRGKGLNWSGVGPPLSSSRACLTTFIAISVP